MKVTIELDASKPNELEILNTIIKASQTVPAPELATEIICTPDTTDYTTELDPKPKPKAKMSTHERAKKAARARWGPKKEVEKNSPKKVIKPKPEPSFDGAREQNIKQFNHLVNKETTPFPDGKEIMSGDYEGGFRGGYDNLSDMESEHESAKKIAGSFE